MGPLLSILIALLAQGLAEEGLCIEGERPWLVLALCALPHLLGAAARRASLAGAFASAARRLALLGALPVLAHAVALGVGGWLATVESTTGLRPTLLDWPTPASLLGLVPFVVYSLIAADARARALDGRPAALAVARRLHARLLLGALAPVVLYVLLAGALGRVDLVRVRVEHVGLDAALYAGVMLALFLTVLPFVLRATWNTRPLAVGPLRELFDAAARRARFACREILVWDTGQRMANAAVVGIAGPLRLVFLSDALLASLSARELLAVFAHEMGHARRHHVLVFGAWTSALILGLDLLAARLLPPGEAWALASLTISLALWYLGFGWLSRRFELDADLFAAELTGDAQGMVDALNRVGGPHGGSTRTWRHFPIERRIAFLEADARDPAVGRALRVRLRLLSICGACACLIVLALWGRELMRARPAELVRASLALGDARAAIAALARVAEPPAQLARQVELAAELELGSRDDGERILTAARSAALDGRAQRALDLIVLGAWRDAQLFEARVAKLLERLPADLREDGQALSDAADAGEDLVLQAVRASLENEGSP